MKPESDKETFSVKTYFKNSLKNYALLLIFILTATIGFLPVIFSLNAFLQIHYGWILVISILFLLFLIFIILPFYKYPSLGRKNFSKDALNLVVKRIYDLTISSIGLIFLLPLFCLIPLAIKVSSPGPVFIKKIVVGLNGRFIELIKFRTLYANADEILANYLEKNPSQKLSDIKVSADPRITKFGRILRMTSIDQLPQFFNVFKGDLSLVGPKAISLKELELVKPDEQRRFSFPPGMSGLWQISKGYDFHEMIKLDLYYVDNWNIFLDIKISLRTVYAVFSVNDKE